jgi:serine protease Do
MEDILLLDATERYLRDEMSPEEKAFFEELRQTKPEVDQFVVEHSLFLQQLTGYGEVKQFKSSLQDIHQQLILSGDITENKPTQAKIVAIWRKYKRTIAVAASIAGITALLISGTISYFSPKNTNVSKEINLLKGQINDVKKDITKNQQDIQKTITGSTTVTPPVTLPDATISGTSFLIDGRGYLATNAHVVYKSKNVYVENTKGDYYKASVVYVNDATDVAILKIEDDRFKTIASLPYSVKKANVELGEQIYTLGYPRREIVYNEGYLSARTGFNGDTISCQIAISANPGNSGGPVLTRNGEIIGILTSKQAQADNVVFAVRSSNIYKALDELRKKNPVYDNIKITSRSNVSGMERVQQIKKIQDFVFMVRVN